MAFGIAGQMRLPLAVLSVAAAGVLAALFTAYAWLGEGTPAEPAAADSISLTTVSAATEDLDAVALDPGADDPGVQQIDAGDWSVMCPPAEGCVMVQQHMAAETNQLILAALFRKGEQGLDAAFYLPTNLRVPEGLTLLLDDRQVVAAPIRLCHPGRCIANTQLSAELVAAIVAADSLQASYHQENGQNVMIQISLRGFEEAVAGLSR